MCNFKVFTNRTQVSKYVNENRRGESEREWMQRRRGWERRRGRGKHLAGPTRVKQTWKGQTSLASSWYVNTACGEGVVHGQRYRTQVTTGNNLSVAYTQLPLPSPRRMLPLTRFFPHIQASPGPPPSSPASPHPTEGDPPDIKSGGNR